MSIASVTVEHLAWGDPRVAYLARIAGYADVDHAMGKLARLWGRCSFLGTSTVGAIEIRACLGDRGEQHLVDCGLGDLVDGGLIRVRGCDGRIEWAGGIRAQQEAQLAERKTSAAMMMSDRAAAQRSAAGKASAAKRAANRGNGIQRPVATESNGPLNPFNGISTESNGEQDLDQESEQGSDTQSARGQRNPTAVQRPVATESNGPLNAKQLWSIEQKISELRVRLAAELGLAAPRHPHPTPTDCSDALARVRESGPDADANLEAVFAEAEREARDKRSIEFVAWSLFRDRAWSRRLASHGATAPGGGNQTQSRGSAAIEAALAIARGESP